MATTGKAVYCEYGIASISISWPNRFDIFLIPPVMAAMRIAAPEILSSYLISGSYAEIQNCCHAMPSKALRDLPESRSRPVDLDSIYP